MCLMILKNIVLYMNKYKTIIRWNALFFALHYISFILTLFLCFDNVELGLRGPQLFLAAIDSAIWETLDINFTISWWLPYHILHVVVLEMWLFNVVKAQTFMKVLTFVTAFIASAPMFFVLAVLGG